jgi:hypothetical protein
MNLVFFVDHLSRSGQICSVMKNSTLKTLLVALSVFCGFSVIDQASARRTIPAPVVGVPTPISPN